MKEHDIHDLLLELDARIRRLEEIPYPEIREQVMGVLQLVDHVHRPVLAKIVAGLKEAGLWKQALADDDLSTLFALYDLVPVAGKAEDLVRIQPPAKPATAERRILIAGFGNALHQDDGFGVELLRRLEKTADLPRGVELLEAGIGGISLVQELMTGYDALIVLDAIEDGEPGEVRVLELDVADLSARPLDAVRDELADIHFAEPGRALALAKAIGKLPAQAFMIGCAVSTVELGQGLSRVVEKALDEAARATVELVRRCLADS